MRKAVQLRVTVYVRGEDEPPNDFARRAARAVRRVIAAGRSAAPDLEVRVRRVIEYDALEDDDENDDAREEPGA